MTSRPGRTQHPYSQSSCQMRPQPTWRAHAAVPFWRGLNLHLTTTTRMHQQQPGWHAHTCPSLPPGARTAVRVSAAGAASAAPPVTHERMPPAGPRDEQQLQPQPPSARRRAAAGDLGLPGPHVAEDFSEPLTGPSNTLQQQQPQQQQQSQQGVRQERAILDSDLTTDRSRLNPVYRMIRKKELQYKRGQAAGAGRQLRQVQRGRGAARPATEGEASEDSGGKGRGLSGAGEAAAMAKGQPAAWRYTSDAGSSTVDAWPAPNSDGSGSGGGGEPGFAGAAADSVIRDSDMATDRSRMNPVYRLIRKTELRYRRTLAEEEKLAAMRGPGPALGDTEQWRQAQRALRVPAPGSGNAVPGDAGSINAGGGGAAASDGSGPAAAPEFQQQRIAPTGNTAVDRTIRIRQISVRMRREAQQQAAAGWGEGRATSAVGPDPARRYTRVRPLSSLSTPAAAGAVDDASWLGTEAAAALVAADVFAEGLVEPQTYARPRPSNSFAAASVAADSDAGGDARAKETEEDEEQEESDGAWRASPWGLPARSSMVQDSELATDRARLNPVFRLIRKTELQKRLARRQADLVSPFKLGGLEEVMTSGGPSKPGIVPSAYLGSVLDPGAATGGVVGRPAPAVRLARGTVAAPRTAAVLQPSVATAPETDSTVAVIAAAGGAAPEAAGSLQRQGLPVGVAVAAPPDGKGGLPGAHGDTRVTAAAATLGGSEPAPAVDSRSGSGSPTSAPERQQQRIAPTGNAAVDRTIRIRQILLRMRQEAQQRAAEGRLQGPAAAAAAARSLPSAGQAGPSGVAAPHRVRMPWEPWLPGVGVSLGGAAAVGSAAPAPPASARPAARTQGGGASAAAKAKGKGQQEGADDGPRTWRRTVAENLTDAHVQSLQRFQREFPSLHIATFLGVTLPAGYEPESMAREAAGEAGGWHNGALDSGGGAAAAAAGAAAGAVAARVQALQLLLIELGVPSGLATQFVSPVLDGLVDAYLVGKRSAEGAGEKVAVLSQLLDTDISQAFALAIKQPSLINRFPDALRSNLEALQSLLSLPRERVVAMVLRYPAVLDMSSKTVASHVEAIAEVLAIDVADPDDMARLTEALCAQPSWLGHDMQSLASKVTAVASSLRDLVQAVGTVGAVGTVAVAAAVVDRAAEGSSRGEVGSGAEGEQRAAGVDGQEAAAVAAEQEEAAASEGKPGLWFFGERMTAAATRDEDVDKRLAARLLLGFPGLLAVSSAKLESKFERLSLLVGGSAAWSREVAGMSPQSLGRCLAASHKVLDRLAYLQATGPAPSKQVLGLAKAVVLSAAEFNAKHPGFAAFQQAHGTKND